MKPGQMVKSQNHRLALLLGFGPSSGMNWIHLHLALNHVPVLGTIFLFLLLLAGWLHRSQEIQRLCLWAFVGLSVISIAIKFTGDFAFEELKGADWLDKAMIQRHEQSADQATTGIFLLGVLAAVGLYLSRGNRPIVAWVSMVLLGASLGTFVLMAKTANLGGQLRHPEIRSKASAGGGPQHVIVGVGFQT